MSDNLEVGDVVKLKSGGERMTIEKIEDGGHAVCVWFEGNQVQRDTFALATLQTYKPGFGGIGVIRG